MKKIGTAIEKSGSVYVYDDGNRHMFTTGGSLHGFTSSTVSVKRSGYIYIYDVNGSVKSTVGAW
jgi:hypothetical protein